MCHECFEIDGVVFLEHYLYNIISTLSKQPVTNHVLESTVESTQTHIEIVHFPNKLLIFYFLSFSWNDTPIIGAFRFAFSSPFSYCVR